MPGRRVERLNEQFRRELTEVLMGEAKDPRLAMVTLTAVRAAPDLSFARVFVAPGADEAHNDEVLKGLRAATPFLRKELGGRMHIRRVPELRFELDHTLAHAQRIERLLHEVAAPASAEGAAQGQDEDEAAPETARDEGAESDA
jgi:ribosome-binding factor A